MSSGKQQTEWGWSLQEPHKHWYPCTKLYGITSQNTVMITCTNVKTSNMSSYLHCFILHSNLTKASVSTAVYMIITIPNLRSDVISNRMFTLKYRGMKEKGGYLFRPLSILNSSSTASCNCPCGSNKFNHRT